MSRLHRYSIAFLGAFALMFVFAAAPANAAPMALDGSWVELDEFMDEPNFFNNVNYDDCDALACAATWDWTSSDKIVFDITDNWVATDEFEVYLDGVLALTTPALADTLANVGDPDDAWLNPDFSKGSLLVAAGTHSIAIRSIKIPGNYSDSTVAFRATVSAIPEPGAVMLFGIGAFIVGTSIRRK